jgi:hypothetical protein
MAGMVLAQVLTFSKQGEKRISAIKLVFSYFYNFISYNNTIYLAVKMGIFPPSTEMLASYIIHRSSSLRIYKAEQVPDCCLSIAVRFPI